MTPSIVVLHAWRLASTLAMSSQSQFHQQTPWRCRSGMCFKSDFIVTSQVLNWVPWHKEGLVKLACWSLLEHYRMWRNQRSLWHRSTPWKHTWLHGQTFSRTNLPTMWITLQFLEVEREEKKKKETTRNMLNIKKQQKRLALSLAIFNYPRMLINDSCKIFYTTEIERWEKKDKKKL